MKIEQMIKKIKAHPDYGKVGMILCHNGVVRETTREGRPVTGLRVSVDRDRLNRLIAEQKQKKGIVEVMVDISDNRKLNIGDDIMQIAVAGDIRDNVIQTLTDTLNRIKSDVTTKKQFFKETK
ncbi:MAG: molybdenum cofactor biosynthesis protein MoaE [Thermodesulfobacteriota bacterium]|nr:molybdenum cofactor biosynthesis protein MoaE [Thermodesulfobacteriota bacterium]